jgi:ABC-2 type transport system permease protein
MVSGRRILADLNVFRREYLRNRVGLFFALVFPVILILVFGAIFSGSSSGSIIVYVQNQDGGPVSTAFINALNSTNTIKVVVVNISTTTLSEYLLSHSSSNGVLIPRWFTQDYSLGKAVNVTVYTDPADSSSAIVSGTVNGVVNAFNLKHAGVPPVLGIQQQTIKSQSYKYIDFLVPGLIGFSILTSPMFSMVNISAEYKKAKLFKQLSLTSLRKEEWLIAKIIWYVILSAISFVLMYVVGTSLFGAHISLSIWIAPFIVIGPLLFVSLGMLIGTVTKTQESAGVIGNIVTFPMMFLSGTFFPLSIMPNYLQTLAHIFPLFYIVDGLNNIMIYNDFDQVLFDLLVLGIIAAVIFSLAVRFFKWRED